MADGLPTRPSGQWAIDKLYYVERYFDAFSTATKTDWASRVYVDLLAGPGRCHLEGRTDQTFDGSPLLACKVRAPFQRLLLIEGDPTLAAALEARVAAYPQAKVMRADCNSRRAISAVQTALDGSLGLVFADALGLDTIRLDTIKTLASTSRFDLIYTFHHQDANRNVQSALASPSEQQRFADGLGANWREAWLLHVKGLSGTTSVGDALEGFFCSQLQLMGYQFVEPLPVVMKNTKNAALYRLILASHHELAVKLWRGISEIRSSGQRSFGFE